MVNGQRSRVKGVHGSMGPTGQPHFEADRWDPRVRPEKGKRKAWFGSGPKSGDGPAQGPTGSA
jgi:hypothetical protein